MKTVIVFVDGRTEDFPNLFPSVDIEGQSVALLNGDYGVMREFEFDEITEARLIIKGDF